ncbi:Rap1-interacting factor 1 N terminal-domain-containing protein [Alternaria rosae]|uniref:Rap1-interacting factor 1 N terminal-domain-containing protein n=1 Tax=Alternaria rosae TaxID=1187941 RepID=UPI001E8DE9FF|nr:Rap1-interacting factor 1 N terminal-domain-containing protein [Alternaria rosae]KAH6881306.1 Rap1-interacting factor 1 N terminal-domain-containing protein [Alternaria rosae]
MVSSKFESLSVRPPTPPKDQEDTAADETVQFLQDPFGEKPIPPRLRAAKRVPNTPEQSPSSDIDIPSSSASARKRVNFELQLCDIPTNKAIAQSWTPTRSSPLKPLPQNRLTKPLKSILKPSDGTQTPPAEDAANPLKYKSFAEMLDAIVKLLASSERGTRLDAYGSLQRTMQAYEKIPDPQALKQKMSLLTQFIRRDIQAPGLAGTGLDSQLIGQAMKLLMALFRITDLISAMDEDFCSFIIDRIIRVASDSSMPKTTVNTHLAVLMQQSFRPKTMTATRVEKVLEALDTIHERTSGHAVQAYRVRIYRKLLQQRPDVMIRHTERWFTHTLKALVSVQKDISQSALDTAVTAAKTIGHDRHVAKSVLSVLNRVKSDGGTIASVFASELDRMLGGDYAVLVPQIVAAVTGLLKDSLDAFAGLKDWLVLINKCLSSDKDQVRLYSNVAVAFLAYSVNFINLATEARLEAWSGMFVKISVHALQRKTPVKKAERDAVSSAYFTMLYYAFRPAASFEQFDRHWTDFIAGLWSPIIAKSSLQHAIPCRIVSALLDGSRKPWNENRALDLRPNFMIQRGELPLVDPKWVRRSIALVLEFVEDILEAALKTESKEQEDEPFQTMWVAVINSLVEASSKEIMASTETKDAMAHIINLLRRIWDSHTDNIAVEQKTEDLWANKFCFLIETVVQKMGAFQFADKCLTRNADNEIEVASTPSHRSRHQGTRSSPLLFLLDLLVTQSEGKLADPVRLRAMDVIIEPCFAAQNTRLSKLELLRDCAASVDGSLKGAVASEFWTRIVTLLDTMLQDPTAPSGERGARSLGKEYEIVVEILSLGSAYLLDKPVGHQILSTLISTVRREAGEGALALAVIEKISEQILKRTPDEDKASCLAYASVLLRNLPKQMSRKVMDQGRQNLWPSNTTARSHDIDPYVHLYGAITSVGSAAYRNLDKDDVEPTKGFLSALSTSVQHCSTSHLAGYLRKIQDAIQVWVEDPEKKMQSKEEPLKSLHREVIAMWEEVNKAIERLPRKDSQTLLHLQALVTAGFLSRRRSIVNISIATWNATFGKENSLRYPTRLEQALRQLRNSVELSLPSLEVQEEDAENKLSFYDSDTSADEVKRAFKSPRVKASPFKISKASRRSKSRSPAVPTSATRRMPSRQTPKIRLRHDDSQIKFEPIVSSPSNPFQQESQVLTDRQKEMIDRQRLSSGIFAKMGAASPQPDDVPSPMEIHSDALTADDLPDHASRTTPLKALAAMGPMDGYLGSSPTPHSRRNTRHIVSEDTDIVTPTAVRNIQFANDDLNSSPPQFNKNDRSNNKESEPDVLVGSSFEYRQPESSVSGSFDEGTTIDEEALLDAVALHENTQMDPESPSDTIMSELPSSTIDLQLTAQIDADMQVHDAPAAETESAQSESNAEYVDAASHPQSSMLEDQAGSDTEVDESQTPTRGPARRSPRKSSQVNTSSTSRVGDSFDNSSAKGTPYSLRSSSRHSMGSPSRPPSGKKPRRTPAKNKKNGKKQTQESPAPAPAPAPAAAPEPEPSQPSDADILDNITVAAPLPPPSNPRGKKRKSTHTTTTAVTTKSPVVVPATTNRKQNLRRSQSLLSQVENSQDLVVDETPAPKRARQSADQDVSEAKRTTPGSSGSKRLSHVQVSPRPRSSESTKPSPVSKDSEMAEQEYSVLDPQAEVEADVEVDAAPSHQHQRTHSQSHSQTQHSATDTPTRSFAERVILTPRSIINQLKSLKDYLFSSPSLVLGREEEREIDDALFDIRRQVHAAGLRGEDERK